MLEKVPTAFEEKWPKINIIKEKHKINAIEPEANFFALPANINLLQTCLSFNPALEESQQGFLTVDSKGQKFIV
jgi:hypothetical protein